MSNRDFHPVERVFRYGVSGVLVSIICSLGVVGFVHILPQIGPVGANILAFCAVQPIGYVIHKTFTFPDTDIESQGGYSGLRRFILTNLASLAVSTAGMALVTNVLRASYLWGIALNWVLIPSTNFLLYRFWVFKVRSQRRGSPA
ncbi:MAG TPA: GtrA family protein [Rhizomicrobium sp.]|nr:GtrA family protein [Rhizomicrobium sp.]